MSCAVFPGKRQKQGENRQKLMLLRQVQPILGILGKKIGSLMKTENEMRN
jgi:hypothetical protein